MTSMQGRYTKDKHKNTLTFMSNFAKNVIKVIDLTRPDSFFLTRHIFLAKLAQTENKNG